MIRYDRRRKVKGKGKVMMERSVIEESKDERRWDEGTTKEKEKKNRRTKDDGMKEQRRRWKRKIKEKYVVIKGGRTGTKKD